MTFCVANSTFFFSVAWCILCTSLHFWILIINLLFFARMNGWFQEYFKRAVEPSPPRQPSQTPSRKVVWAAPFRHLQPSITRIRNPAPLHQFLFLLSLITPPLLPLLTPPLPPMTAARMMKATLLLISTCPVSPPLQPPQPQPQLRQPLPPHSTPAPQLLTSLQYQRLLSMLMLVPALLVTRLLVLEETMLAWMLSLTWGLCRRIFSFLSSSHHLLLQLRLLPFRVAVVGQTGQRWCRTSAVAVVLLVAAAGWMWVPLSLIACGLTEEVAASYTLSLAIEMFLLAFGF